METGESTPVQKTFRLQMEDWLRNHAVPRWWESVWPSLVGIVVFIAMFFIPRHGGAWRGAVVDVIPTAVSAAAILAAFLASSQSILLVVGDSQSMRRFRKTSHLKRLNTFVAGAWKSLLLFVVLGMTLLVLRSLTESTPVWDRVIAWLMHFACALLAYGLSSSTRVLQVMLRLMALPSHQSHSDDVGN